MKDEFDNFRILETGDEVETPKIVDIEQGTLYKQRQYPSYDPDVTRTIRVSGDQFAGTLSFLLEENFPALNATLRRTGAIAPFEEVTEITWEDQMPYSITVRGGKGGETIPFKASTLTKLTKTAHDNKSDPELIPKGVDLAVYVESLKLHLINSKHLDGNIRRLIQKLPAPEKVSADFSDNESIVLFETINYLWKKITGQDILDNVRTTNSFKGLHGCYIMLTNGLLLHGINHYSIIKNNSALITSLLDLNGLTFQEYLSSDPERIIAYVIRNGGVRMFINSKQEGFFQATEEAYSKWARAKIRKFQLKRKIVKIMDLRVRYKGWKSGVTINL